MKPTIPQPPSLLQYWLLESPTVPLVGLGILVVMLLLAARSRADRRLFRAALIVTAAGLAWWSIAALIETDRERITSQTLELIDAIEQGQTARMRELIDPSADFTLKGGTVIYDYEGIFRAYEMVTRNAAVRVPARDVHGAEVHGEDYAVTMVTASLQAESQAYGSFDGSGTFLIVWRHFDDGQWRAVEINFHAMNGLVPPQPHMMP